MSHELDTLAEYLHDSLAFQLAVNTDITAWRDNNMVSNQNFIEIEEIIDFVFDDIMEQYRYTDRVYNELENARLMIQGVVWASVNVPYPQDAIRHLERVVDNTYTLFMGMYYRHIRTLMIETDHCVQVIQRNWKNAIANPNYMICRRRLIREANELEIPSN